MKKENFQVTNKIKRLQLQVFSRNYPGGKLGSLFGLVIVWLVAFCLFLKESVLIIISHSLLVAELHLELSVQSGLLLTESSWQSFGSVCNLGWVPNVLLCV